MAVNSGKSHPRWRSDLRQNNAVLQKDVESTINWTCQQWQNFKDNGNKKDTCVISGRNNLKFLDHIIREALRKWHWKDILKAKVIEESNT